MYKNNVQVLPILQLVLVSAVLTFIISCAGGDPATPSPTNADAVTGQSTGTGNHMLWGYWEGYIPESHDTIELVPVRGSQFHLNVRRFLEETPCTDCIIISNIVVDSSEQTLSADIQLRHPFPGLDKYTGFDVRAVVISDGSLYFPQLDATIPDPDLGDFALLNPDGYTRLWNTLEFPPGSMPFPILEYSRGKFASYGDFTGTVNPFIEYYQEPRSHFPAGQAMTHRFVFNLPDGVLRFGYAVDASWEPPTVEPPLDLMTDFPPSANALEPHVLSVEVDELRDTIGSWADLRVDVLDRQQLFFGAPSTMLTESPDLWRGLIEPYGCIGHPDPSMLEYITSTFTQMRNDYGAPAGEYKALTVVKDRESDYYLGDVNHEYQLFTIEVIESIEPEVEGEIVFVGPEIEPEFPPPALNVLHLNLDTMEETQLTPYSGMGAIFEEPRINPLGTHMLLTFCPTPTASHVTMYEIGGSSWDVSPPGAYDGNADFHPDGEHILVASGTQYGDTPELYSMEYDGSNRELIATAPDTIRNPRWNADGTKIVMTLGIDPHDPPNSALYIYDVDAETFTEIAAAPGVDEHPCWSPVLVDGQEWIAFDSSRDHHPDYNTDIYIINPVTEEIICRFDNGVYERHPSFSPDGLSFVYCATDGDDEELFVHFWKTGETIQLTDDDSYDGDPSWGWNW